MELEKSEKKIRFENVKTFFSDGLSNNQLDIKLAVEKFNRLKSVKFISFINYVLK